MSRILLLEDDLSLVTGLSFALKKQGFALNTARTLREADAAWADGSYDLLVLDVLAAGRLRLCILREGAAHLKRAHHVPDCVG